MRTSDVKAAFQPGHWRSGFTALEAELPAVAELPVVVYVETREMQGEHINKTDRNDARGNGARKGRRNWRGIQNIDVVRANKATCKENTNAP
jgi:hypothetical protein